MGFKYYSRFKNLICHLYLYFKRLDDDYYIENNVWANFRIMMNYYRPEKAVAFTNLNNKEETTHVYKPRISRQKKSDDGLKIDYLGILNILF